MKGLKQKKGHLMEVQINGGTTTDKVDYGYKFFEKEVPVEAVFQKDEIIEIIGVTRLPHRSLSQAPLPPPRPPHPPPRTAPTSLSVPAHELFFSPLRGSAQWCIDGDRRGCDGGRGTGGGGGHRPRRGGPGDGGWPREASQGGQSEGQEARRPAEAALQPHPPAVRRDDLGGDHDAQGEDGVEPVRDRQVHRGQAQGAPVAQLPQAAARAAQEARRRRQTHQGQELLQDAADAHPSPSRLQAQRQAGCRQTQAQVEGRREAQAEGQGPCQGQGRHEAQGARQGEGSSEAQGARQAGCQAQAQAQAGREAQSEGGSEAEGRRRDQDEGDLRAGTVPRSEGSEDVGQGHAREEGGASGQEARGGGEEGPSEEGRASEEGGRAGEEGASPEGQEVEQGLEEES